MHLPILFSAFVLPSLIAAQLSGSVGPLTTRASKAVKTCSVLNFGGKADGVTDIGPAIAAAFASCKTGGTVYVPPGNYALSTFQTLSGGSKWAFQLDGIISRTGSTSGGNMILIEDSTDFEMYSSTSKGAIQGFGYQFLENGVYGPRILRLQSVTSYSVHDIALVDSPAFHLVLDTCNNGEIYNMIIRGGNLGGLDGIDIWGNNNHVHDIEVTNKDECVTVKNPSTNFLIENIYCNWSGGCAIGSLGADTAISNIIYRNIYTWESNQMFMLKSNGGSGTVSTCTFENFIGHSNAYSLDLNAFWSDETPVAGNGVTYENLVFTNWTGTAADGLERGPINVVCPNLNPCHGLTISDFAIWTDTGTSIKYICDSAYGTGFCLKSGSTFTSFSTTTTITATPTGFSAPKMPSDLPAGLGITASIPIPPIPTTFFPGAKPASALLG